MSLPSTLAAPWSAPVGPLPWIREGKFALRWTRLSCHSFRRNAVRLQLFALAYNLANFLRSLALPREVKQWSLTSLAREAGQDRRPDRAPRAVRGFPARRGGGAAGAVRRDPAQDRPFARTAHGNGLTGADHGAASVEGRTMRRRSGRARRKPVGRPVARSRIAHADRGPAFGGSSVDAQPFEEHRRTRDRRLSGRCRLNCFRPRTNDASKQLAGRLRAETEGEVLFDAPSRGRYATDASIYQIMPVGVLVPKSERDVATALDIARDLKVPVLPRGAGTSEIRPDHWRRAGHRQQQVFPPHPHAGCRSPHRRGRAGRGARSTERRAEAARPLVSGRCLDQRPGDPRRHGRQQFLRLALDRLRQHGAQRAGHQRLAV